MAAEPLQQLMPDLTEKEEGYQGEESPLSEFLQTEEKEFEWLISPEQFVDFWIASIFFLVGTWQIITIFFLLVQ